MANLLNKINASVGTVVTTVDTVFTAADNASSVLRTYSTEWALRAQHEAKANSDIRHAEFLDRCEQKMDDLIKSRLRRESDPEYANRKAEGKKLLDQARASRENFIKKQGDSHIAIAAE